MHIKSRSHCTCNRYIQTSNIHVHIELTFKGSFSKRPNHTHTHTQAASDETDLSKLFQSNKDINWVQCIGIIVIVVGNGYGDQSSNPGRGCLHFI